MLESVLVFTLHYNSGTPDSGGKNTNLHFLYTLMSSVSDFVIIGNINNIKNKRIWNCSIFFKHHSLSYISYISLYTVDCFVYEII